MRKTNEARQTGSEVIGTLSHRLRRARTPILRGELSERRPTSEIGRSRACLGAWRDRDERGARHRICHPRRPQHRSSCGPLRPRGWSRRSNRPRCLSLRAHSANYAVTAANDSATAEERDWQYRRHPKHLRPVAFPTRGEDSAPTLRRCSTSCVSTTATPSLSA